MSTQIVQTNVAITLPPAPSTLLGTGAIISQGGTTLSAGTRSLLTSAADLTGILAGSKANLSLVVSGSGPYLVTVTTASAHGFTVGDTLELTLSGMTPAAYNGTYQCTIIDGTTFSYTIPTNPGSLTVPGVVTDADVAELTAQVNTFFAQGSQVSVYVLELGQGSSAQGVTALSAFITANPELIFAFLVPSEWDGESTFKTFLATFNAPTKIIQFFITSTTGTYSAYASTLKSAFVLVPAPGTPSSEFTCAAPFYRVLSYAPSSSNQVPQLGFSFVYGVTPWSGLGIQATLAAMKAAGVNYIYTGAEGGLSNTILEWGSTMDGQQFNFWYSVYWMQINQDLNISNAVINGSNNPAAPLYNNQQGINRLQAVARDTCVTAVSYGLALGNVVTTQLSQAQFAANVSAGLYAGQVVVNAVPFDNWNALNPSAYRIGQYGGLSVAYSPQLGFQQIIININATETV